MRTFGELRAEQYKVQEIKTLGKHDDGKAKELLKQIADQVQPIMRKRQFTCPLLVEFFPKNPQLLGLNVNGGGGATDKICIRLRPAHNERTFLHYESLLGTMLHELVHNMIGPHNVSFYKLLDELKAECEELMAAGVRGSGNGFDAPAAGRAGGDMPWQAHQQHYDQRRATILQATEQRIKRVKVMSNGPQRIGGGTLGGIDWRLLSPAQAAAIAAERRAADSTWCGAGQQGEQEGDAGGDAGGDADSAPMTDSGAGPPVAGGGTSSTSDNDDDVVVVAEVPGRTTAWTCGACTYVNDNPLHLACAVCGTARN